MLTPSNKDKKAVFKKETVHSVARIVLTRTTMGSTIIVLSIFPEKVRTSERQRRGKPISKVELENLSELCYCNMHPFRKPTFNAHLGYAFTRHPQGITFVQRINANVSKNLYVCELSCIMFERFRNIQLLAVGWKQERVVVNVCYVYDMLKIQEWCDEIYSKF